MIFSKTSKYALRILAFMASNDYEIYTAKLMHEKLDVPDRYLRKLLTQMSKDGLIRSTQGRSGGYTFTRSIDKIFLSDIVNSVEGLESVNSCVLSYDTCAFDHACAMHKVWEKSKQTILETLNTTSLADVKNQVETI